MCPRVFLPAEGITFSESLVALLLRVAPANLVTILGLGFATSSAVLRGLGIATMLETVSREVARRTKGHH